MEEGRNGVVVVVVVVELASGLEGRPLLDKTNDFIFRMSLRLMCNSFFFLLGEILGSQKNSLSFFLWENYFALSGKTTNNQSQTKKKKKKPQNKRRICTR